MRSAKELLLDQIRPHISDARVMEAMAAVPRDAFVPPELVDEAWDNAPLPIGSGQTISQPLVVARMCQLLELDGDERVLDVGTGSGYHAALLAYLSRHVWSIERYPELTEQARRNLARAGVRNVTLIVGDGTRGLPEEAPFDAINVAAAAGAAVPHALEEQLAVGGRLVVPVEDGDQRLFVVHRTHEGFVRTALERVRFVPLVGD